MLPDAECIVISPGRLSLPGEHADYNDGVVLPVAVDRYVTMVIKLWEDDRVIQCELDLDASAESSLEELDKRRDLCGESQPDWAFSPT